MKKNSRAVLTEGFQNCRKIFVGYCYHLLNVIRFSLAQSDHIKRRLQYFKKIAQKLFFVDLFNLLTI